MYVGHFDFAQPLLQRVPALYTRDECAALIAGLADAEWLPATVNAASGRVVNDRLRNNDLAVLREEAIGADLWRRIQPHVPATMTAEWPEAPGQQLQRRTVRAIGLFSPVRVYRYHVGHHFGLHNDQSYSRGDGARSLLTLLVYLDDDLEGGETDFPEQGQRIAPRAGEALWFQHMVLHAGLPVTRGIKHVLRSDVMYAP